MRTRTASRTRRKDAAASVVDCRLERMSRRTEIEIKADLGVVHCPTCRQETIPLASGCCAWCDRQLVRKAAKAA